MREGTLRICRLCGTRYPAGARFCQLDGEGLIDADDPFIGTMIQGRYRLDERIGAGGMGIVYRATDLEGGPDCAIKLLRPEVALHEEARRRFEREAKVLTRLDHPSIVSIQEFGFLGEGSLYLVMELLEGETLADRTARTGRLEVEELLPLIAQVAEALDAAHDAGIVHRDLKPENIFLTTEGDVKLLDFGIARVLDDETIASQTGLIFGTARYISPEGARGGRTDARSDVYSLAVITYEALSGSLPFESDRSVGLLVAHANETPRPIGALLQSGALPKASARAIMRALSKDPAARHQRASEFAVALAEGEPRAYGPRIRASVASLAFALGFAAVYLVLSTFRAGAREDGAATIAGLLEQARVAAARGHHQGPSSALELSQKVLEIAPSHPEALRLRQRALRRGEGGAIGAVPPAFSLEQLTPKARAGAALRLRFEMSRAHADEDLRLIFYSREHQLEVPIEARQGMREFTLELRPPAPGRYTAQLFVNGQPHGDPLAIEVGKERASRPSAFVDRMLSAKRASRPQGEPSKGAPRGSSGADRFEGERPNILTNPHAGTPNEGGAIDWSPPE
ncbi:MAG: serine/threonine protein kinase [Sandaracinaceae bacterium]|nr:serine/threonine protein kinase [Sandaracinaceae bacterium]